MSIAVTKNSLFKYRDLGIQLRRKRQWNLGCPEIPLSGSVFRAWLPWASVCVIQVAPPSSRTSCDEGNVLRLCHSLRQLLATCTLEMWLVRPRNRIFKLYLIVINLNEDSHTWLVVSTLDNATSSLVVQCSGQERITLVSSSTSGLPTSEHLSSHILTLGGRADMCSSLILLRKHIELNFYRACSRMYWKF